MQDTKINHRVRISVRPGAKGFEPAGELDERPTNPFTSGGTPAAQTPAASLPVSSCTPPGHSNTHDS